MKKTLLFILVSSSILICAACGEGTSTNPTAANTAAPTATAQQTPSEELLEPGKYEKGETFESKFGFSFVLPKGFSEYATNDKDQSFRYENNSLFSIIIFETDETDAAKINELTEAAMGEFVQHNKDVLIEATESDLQEFRANGVSGAFKDAWIPEYEEQQAYCYRTMYLSVDGSEKLYRINFYMNGTDIATLEYYNEFVSTLKKL